MKNDDPSHFWQSKGDRITEYVYPTKGLTTEDADERGRISDLLDRNTSKLLFGAPVERSRSNDTNLGVIDKVESPQLSDQLSDVDGRCKWLDCE